ncbi:hypothetical protein GCM10027047_20220 [Rhodococcus aerolatus]
MAETSGRSTDDTTATSTDGSDGTGGTSAGARAGASRAGSSPAGSGGDRVTTREATDDPATEQLPAVGTAGEAGTSDGATGGAAGAERGGDGTRHPARSVPGGVGIPGRAAPRRVLGAHESMPGEEPTARSGAATGSTTDATDPTTGSTTRDAGTADDEATTTLPAQDGGHRSGTGAAAAGAAAGVGATAWSQQRRGDTAGSSDATPTTALGSGDDPTTSRLDTADHDEQVRAGAGADHDDPDARGPHDPAAAAAVDDRAEPKVRRGTGDLGLLVLRVALGADLLGHGLQKLPGLFGGSGIDGYTQLLTDGGYRQAGVLAYVGAISEIGAGALLILGLLTPLAAAAAIGVLVNTWFFREAATPGQLQIFSAQGGAELELVLLAAAVAVALAGPGRGALDARRRWATRPTWDGLLAVLVGAGAGVAVWFLLNGANPFA